MPSLNRQTLSALNAGVEAAAPNDLPVTRILQIGDGNFLRAFVEWMVDVTNGTGKFNGRVTIASPLPVGCTDKITAQEGLYTVLLRGVQQGKQVTSRRLITCVDKAMNPYAEWDAFLACAADPSLRFVVSNTTEAGIAYAEEALESGKCPNNFPAKVTALLYHRFVQLGGTAKTGLVFLPCELIEANGTNLRRYVLQHAAAWNLPAEFVQWVERDNVFLNTLVDRIVPGFPAGEADALYAELGYTDPLMVAAEPFHLWVIEGPRERLQALSDEFPLAKAGLDVVWTDDLRPYRTRKVRILNGAHTASALAAYTAGIDTVKGMIDDEVVSKYLDKLMFEEIVPFVPLADAERKQYAATIMERFANPFIRHELISIALNSVSKWQVRVLPTVKDFAADRGISPACLGFSLAALLNFYHGSFNAAGEYVGNRDGQPYPIKDNAEVLAVLSEAWRNWQPGQPTAALVKSVLADARLWGEDLNAIKGLTDVVTQELDNIKVKGVKTAMRELAV
ncbi:tagaturonate reductase [Uliginosibacterium sp. sgz301328]|uniref:tagaturonate reductase n=1 Tax=Uliginosibacterium sp. sgz301328 TaxID=3243764 RepID=UPI00359F0A47